ncbi:hypothetical protein OY671_008931, partial [Metschnikowia pulcherrima]
EQDSRARIGAQRGDLRVAARTVADQRDDGAIRPRFGDQRQRRGEEAVRPAVGEPGQRIGGHKIGKIAVGSGRKVHGDVVTKRLARKKRQIGKSKGTSIVGGSTVAQMPQYAHGFHRPFAGVTREPEPQSVRGIGGQPVGSRRGEGDAGGARASLDPGQGIEIEEFQPHRQPPRRQPRAHEIAQRIAHRSRQGIAPRAIDARRLARMAAHLAFLQQEGDGVLGQAVAHAIADRNSVRRGG